MPSRSDCSPSPSLSQVMLHDLDVLACLAEYCSKFHAAADPENHLVSCLVFMVLHHGCQKFRNVSPPPAAALLHTSLHAI